jgi:thioredoxin
MNRTFRFCIPVLLLFFTACGSGPEQQYEQLEANAFRQKISESPEGIIVDVRTPAEFAEGHIDGAVNIDWNGNTFDPEAAKLDRAKPVFVYCLAGGRSTAAAERLRQLGFQQIAELKGGMLQWRANNLPETASQPSGGMTPEAFKKLVTDDRLVLVDFYAEWCGPCKKMEPLLEEITKEYSATVKVVRIDVDENPAVAKYAGVEALPTLFLLKDNVMRWRKTGLATKEELLDQLEK